MSFSPSGTVRPLSSGNRNEPNDNIAASSVTPPPADHERAKRIGNALRWGEALWISKQKPLRTTIAAFHDSNVADDALPPCFMVPSLPQLSTDFIDLARMMDPVQPFIALFLSSEKRNAETGSSIHRLAQHYVDEINKFHPTGPVAVGGWSAGAAVALVVAQRLLELGREVPLLIVIDGAPPAVDIGPISPFEKLKLAWLRLANLATCLAWLGRDLVLHLGNRRSENRSVRQAVRFAWQNSACRRIWQKANESIANLKAVRVLGKAVALAHPAENASHISGLPSDHRAFAMALYDTIVNYTPGKNYPGRVVVFEATAEPARSSERVARKWSKIANTVDIVPVEGTHMSIVGHPDGLPMARDICRRLREAAGTSARQSGHGLMHKPPSRAP